MRMKRILPNKTAETQGAAVIDDFLFSCYNGYCIFTLIAGVSDMKFIKMVHFTKEGKGIDKDAPPKRAFFRYIELFWRKRFKLIGTNVLYVIFNILMTALVIAIMYILSSLSLTITGTTNIGEWMSDQLNADTFYRVILIGAMMFTCIPIFATGPFQAGFTYLLKSFVKEEPVFLWTDFSTKARSNKKLSLKVGLINGIIGFLLILDAVVYVSIANESTGIYANIPTFLLFIAAVFIIFGFALFFMMNLYIYPMIVTFHITLKQLYKNAFIFAFIKWLPNMLILIADLLIIAVPLFLIPGTAAFYVSGILFVFITPAWIGFTNNFYVYPIIKKYMIDNEAADKSEHKKEESAPAEFVPTEGMQRFINGRYLDDEEYAEYLKNIEEKEEDGTQ